MALKVSSNRDGAFLMIDRTFRPDYNRAELSHGSMNAAVEFYKPGLSTLSSFFSELAAQWRGWEGERQWRSLEAEAALSATHDRLGTITLAVRLRSSVYTDIGPTWSASGVIFLDAGGLDTLARDAAALTV